VLLNIHVAARDAKCCDDLGALWNEEDVDEDGDGVDGIGDIEGNGVAKAWRSFAIGRPIVLDFQRPACTCSTGVPSTSWTMS